jgi:rare lipoprotein A
MFRMITLMWIMGVMLCAMPVQAGTLKRGGNDAGTDVTARFEWGTDGTLAMRRVHVDRDAQGSNRYSRSTKSQRLAQSERSPKATRVARTARPARAVANAAPSAPSKEKPRLASRKHQPRTAEARPTFQNPLTALLGVFQTGIASHYGEPQRLASGGWFNPSAMTAAHKTLPFGTKVRVTHLGSGRSVDVTINDRGPYIGGRIIDLSTGAADKLGIRSAGLAKVKLEVLGR